MPLWAVAFGLTILDGTPSLVLLGLILFTSGLFFNALQPIVHGILGDLVPRGRARLGVRVLQPRRRDRRRRQPRRQRRPARRHRQLGALCSSPRASWRSPSSSTHWSASGCSPRPRTDHPYLRS